VEKEDILEGKIDSLMWRLEKMEIEKKEAQDLNAAEARSTCEECGEYGHVHKDCPEEAVTPGFKGKPECINTCAPGLSFTHALTQRIPKTQCKRVKRVLNIYYMTDSLYSNTPS
jgi:hypothetical protein